MWLDYATLLEYFMCVCVSVHVCVGPPGVVFGRNSVRWYEGQLTADAHILLPKTLQFI